MELQARIALEKRIVTGLCEHMARKGYALVSVYDGGEHVKCSNIAEVLENVFGVDESTITFEKEGKRGGVFCVHGNAEDIISDYSAHLDPDVGEYLDTLGG